MRFWVIINVFFLKNFKYFFPSSLKSFKKTYIQIAANIAGTNKQYENISPIAKITIKGITIFLEIFSFEYNISTTGISIATIAIPTDK